MNSTGDPRGILYPEELPTFQREAAPAELADRVRWFWWPRWNLPEGQQVRQKLLPFPASNLVVETPLITLNGPTSRASHRLLVGQGWAVGALLRPAGLAGLHPAPREIRDLAQRLWVPDLLTAVKPADPVPGFTAWCLEHLPEADENGLLANRMEELIAKEREIHRVEQLAERMFLSVRSVQRLARRYVGLPPLAIIRRYRLQEAAQRLREDPGHSITAVAAELGYADHSHLAADFREVLGITPNDYRRDSGTISGD